MNSTSARRFLDTNVLVYAFDLSEVEKRGTAVSLIADAASHGTGVLSVQVLGEFFHATVVRRQLLTAAEALRAIEEFRGTFPVEPIDYTSVAYAIAIHLRYQLRYWDSLIVATANRSGCAEIFSEDLNHGQDYSGSTVVNPFLAHGTRQPR